MNSKRYVFKLISSILLVLLSIFSPYLLSSYELQDVSGSIMRNIIFEKEEGERIRWPSFGNILGENISLFTTALKTEVGVGQIEI